jgi:SPP1 gp7 family putative phage head morphogenesis protein
MSITSDAAHQAALLRAVVDHYVDTTTSDLTVSWARLWVQLERDWSLAVQEIIAAETTGRLTSAQLFRLTRVRHALSVSQEALDRLAGQATVTITGRLGDLVTDATAREVGLIAAQLPADMNLDVATSRAIDAITRRATEQVTSLTRPLAADAYQVMLSEIQRGIALGTGPRASAARMLQRTRGGFDGGLSRATRIARTEMLDAYRSAAQTSDEANADVLTGWRWSASLSPRTCPACLSMHGRVFPLSTPGPQGHVNCRCARLPVTKSWAQLGFIGMTEPPDPLPDARSWFARLPRAERLAIMGTTRLRLLEAGDVTWDQLATKVPNPGWRPSWQPRSLTGLRSLATRTG